VLVVHYVAPRLSCTGLVRGCPHPDGGLANFETAAIRSSSLDFLGLLRAPWHVGNVGRFPSLRMVAFRWDKLQIALWEAVLWIVGLVITDHYVGGWFRRTISLALPATVLGTYPRLSGWLYFVDVVFGIALVAYSEEIVFRRCARHIFKIYMDDGYGLVVVTSLLFGAYHWWTGLGNIVEATIVGVLLMLFFRRSGALWPVVLAHYLIDIADFA
jgi:uncharacterized protein